MNSHPYTPPANTGLTIIHQDKDILVLEKPAGLLSVPGRGAEKQDSLASRVQAEFPEALVVHRLDMETSGIMLMARNPESQRAMGRLFESRCIDKTYTAVVSGQLQNNSGEINFPLISDWLNRPRQKIDSKLGKPAKTAYRVIDYDAQQHTTRVELFPETGRSHQLRVHMMAIGHPISGDRLYNQTVNAPSDRLLLHASSLEFSHPSQHKTVKFDSPVPF